MKKCIIITAILFILSGLGFGAEVIFELKGSYFSPTQSEFRDIYGGGLMFGGEVTIGSWNKLELWAGGSFFAKKGQLSYTKEETKVSIIPLGGGVKFKASTGSVNFYVGVGLQYYNYKETNEPMGEAKKGGLGFIGKIGGIVKLHAGLVIDLYIDYSRCKMTPADFTINIGGIKAGIGLGYEFR